MYDRTRVLTNKAAVFRERLDSTTTRFLPKRRAWQLYKRLFQLAMANIRSTDLNVDGIENIFPSFLSVAETRVDVRSGEREML